MMRIHRSKELPIVDTDLRANRSERGNADNQRGTDDYDIQATVLIHGPHHERVR